MEPVTTPAVILRRFDHGEADQVVWMLTPRRGRLAAIAPSARRSRRRFPGGVEPFARVTATVTPPRRGELWRLEELTPRAPQTGLRGSLEGIACAGAACEVAAELGREADPAPSLFARLEDYLEALDGGAVDASGLFAFLLGALAAAGLEPQFRHCARCGAAPQANPASGEHFDPGEGGRLCPSCPPRAPGAIPVRHEWLDALARLRTGERPELPREPRQLVWRHLEQQLGRRLRSYALLDELALA